MGGVSWWSHKRRKINISYKASSVSLIVLNPGKILVTHRACVCHVSRMNLESDHMCICVCMCVFINNMATAWVVRTCHRDVTKCGITPCVRSLPVMACFLKDTLCKHLLWLLEHPGSIAAARVCCLLAVHGFAFVFWQWLYYNMIFVCLTWHYPTKLLPKHSKTFFSSPYLLFPPHVLHPVSPIQHFISPGC